MTSAKARLQSTHENLRHLRFAALLFVFAGALTACGGGGGGGGGTPAPVTLTSIAIAPAPASVAVAATLQLMATGKYSDGSSKDITSTAAWASSAAGFASIGATTGLVTGVAVGTTTASAAVGAVTSSATVTVTAAALVSIAVTPASATVAKGQQQAFVATGTYADKSTHIITANVTWTTGAASIATISNTAGSNGHATGAAAGSTSINAALGAISSSPAGSATLTVTPPVLVSVAITPTAPTIAVGKMLQFTVVGTLSDGSTENLNSTASWTSSMPAIASITPTGGVATATAVGPTSVSATLTGMAAPTPVVLTVANTVYAYATDYDAATVSQYVIGAAGTPAAGALTPLSPASVPTGTKPFSVSVEPTGQYAYVANFGSNTVSEFTIGAGGALTPVGTGTIATGREPNGVTIDPADKHAYVANFQDDTISQYTIGSNGALIPMAVPTVATGPNPASVAIDPSGRYAYVGNFGANAKLPPPGPETISEYTIGTDGSLTPMTPATVVSGAGPNALVIDP